VHRAWAFPGLGAGLAPSERSFYAAHAVHTRPLLELAAAAAQEDLLEAVASPGHEVTAAAQELLVHALNCAAGAIALQHGLRPALVLGHSLGLYAALVAAGSLSYPESLAVIRSARQAVCRACRPGDYALLVVVGLHESDVLALITGTGATATAIVNRNSAVAFALAGPPAELRQISADATQQGAFKVALLTADLPYHHPALLTAVSAPFRDVLQQCAWALPAFPVFSTVDQRPLETVPELIDYTTRNLVTPVDWTGTIRALHGLGVNQVIETGPGRSLQRAAAFIEPSPPHLALAQALQRGSPSR
jgi:[acyl-carrier-protein] S-malonyltransferase